jgi:predicted heme/steroid binding protein
MFKPLLHPLTTYLKVILLTEETKFTLEELAEYNGTGGKPAYVAYKGKVYDVSASSFWLDGDHFGAHQAGKDLTEELELAPHGGEVLERTKLVGVLV